MHIFGKEMVKSWPEFYADHDGTNGFWKFWDFDQNNPVLKFDTFLADISVQVHAIGPKFDLMDSFSTLIKVNQKVLQYSKILQNLGITFESRLCSVTYFKKCKFRHKHLSSGLPFHRIMWFESLRLRFRSKPLCWYT